MDDKYFITIYMKVKISNDVIALISVKSINEAYIESDDDIDTAYYIDKYGKQNILNDGTNPYSLVNNDRFVYNYPVSIEEFRKVDKNAKNDKELFKDYKKNIRKKFNLAVYSKRDDNYKILTFDEDKLKDKVDSDLSNIEEPLFDSFDIEFDPDSEEIVGITSRKVKEIIKLINDKKYDVLERGTGDFLRAYNLRYNETEFNKKDNTNIPMNEAEAGDSNSQVQTEKQDASQTKELKPHLDMNALEKDIDELNNLVGLVNVKKEIRNLVAMVMYRAKALKYGIKLERPNLNMVFTGNPGTGKTTTARLIAKILYHAGYTASPNFREVTTKDLVGKYVGQTAPKTSELIEKNAGGVIFLDEAYGLTSKGNSFASEAFQEILKAMEDKKTVFIFAGYKKEMEQFVNYNSGFASRVGINMNFEDYDVLELYKMFENRVHNANLLIDDDLKKVIMDNIKRAKNTENFGNGRYIDKLFGQVLLMHSLNTAKCDDEMTLRTLTSDDYNSDVEEVLMPKKNKIKIGFNK